MIIRNESRFTLPVEGPLYVPFYNQWLQNVYLRSDPFDLDPFTLRATSTSGSPVVLGKSTFAGFLKERPGSFHYDGNGRLHVELGEGQELYVEERCDPWEAWQRYNAIVLEGRIEENNRHFWKDVEYCTWVEQKKFGFARNLGYTGRLTESFVYDYMKRIDRLGLPKGKLTIDAGWAIEHDAEGKSLFGDWEIDRSKFPHFERLIHDIANEGFTPGLWFAAGYITANSRIAKAHPDWIGIPFSGASEVPTESDKNFYIPSEGVKQHYASFFRPYVEMGIKKFKLDMYYEDKAVMKELLRLSYEALKQLDETIEVEIHIPDIFVSRYGDAVRTNDVLIRPDGLWRGVTEEHYRVCRYSSPDKVINLDHVGSNCQDVSEDNFMAHWTMLKEYDGYPAVSLLPDDFSAGTIDRFRSELIEKTQQQRQVES